jgi:hypothetical protein
MSTVLYINHFPLFGLGNYTCMFMKNEKKKKKKKKESGFWRK